MPRLRGKFVSLQRLRDRSLTSSANVKALQENYFHWAFKEDYATAHMQTDSLVIKKILQLRVPLPCE